MPGRPATRRAGSVNLLLLSAAELVVVDKISSVGGRTGRSLSVCDDRVGELLLAGDDRHRVALRRAALRYVAPRVFKCRARRAVRRLSDLLDLHLKSTTATRRR